jgi:hypothetical protein
MKPLATSVYCPNDCDRPAKVPQSKDEWFDLIGIDECDDASSGFGLIPGLASSIGDVTVDLCPQCPNARCKSVNTEAYNIPGYKTNWHCIDCGKCWVNVII